MREVAAADSQGLAPYAQRSADSRGRRHAEREHAFRSVYQRDRDRIIHSRAFRRLEYKTQVFVNHEGDHYRTRLTHSIEVNQIARTVARALALNEDLVESLALSHDLGHTPFGHLGEEVLDERLREHGGFNHNRQTLRIVEHLEDRYPAFPGLNLSWEVREGIAKHSGAIDLEAAPEFAEYEPDRQPPLEAQMIDLVDEIAYNHHDVDDGLDSSLLDAEALAGSVPLFGDAWSAARTRLAHATPRQLQAETLRTMIDRLVSDLVRTTREAIDRAGVGSVAEVRRLDRGLVGLSPDTANENRTLKRFLNVYLYRHQRIENTMNEARGVLHALFDRYLAYPDLLPHLDSRRSGGDPRERVIADYIAGMTDRFAIQESRRPLPG